MRKTGLASLPLHTGKAPRWLFKRMVRLSGAIAEAVVDEYGQDEFLRRLSDPHWFQAFGCVLGFDWHSSGVTTTVTGALKQSLKSSETGVLMAGGKGKASRNTLEEIQNSSLSEKKIQSLMHSSRLSARVDTSLVQDSYNLYHHALFYTEKGEWAVVQQGMNAPTKYARRYHWLSANVRDFVEDPHSAICCDSEDKTLNLTTRDCREARKTSLDLVKDNPDHLRRYFGGQQTLGSFTGEAKSLHMRRGHWISQHDLTERDWAVLKNAYEIQPESYEELISLRGVGPKKVRALALIANVVHGNTLSWKDPVKYSFAHGGKDGTPYPVDRKTYDSSIQTLKDAVEAARMGDEDRRKALKKLSALTS